MKSQEELQVIFNSIAESHEDYQSIRNDLINAEDFGDITRKEFYEIMDNYDDYLNRFEQEQKDNKEELLNLISNIRGYIQAENMEQEHKELFNMAVKLEDKIALLVGED